MKKSTKTILGILAFMPFVLYAMMFIVMFIVMFGVIAAPEHNNGKPPFEILLVFPVEILLFIVLFGMMIYCIVNVFSNPNLPQSKKALWAVVLFLGNMLAIPFYWYFYIWCEPKPSEATAAPLTDESGNAIIYCASCGKRHPFNTYACDACGKPLHGPSQPAGGGNGGVGYETIGTLIPYRNTYSLVAYYLSVFSIIPVLGLILGPAAFITGILGLKDVKAHREHKGTLHTWIGIMLGCFTTLGNIALIAGLYVYFRSI